MTVQAEIKAVLDALGSLGTLTTDFMPATPDVIGTIYIYSGLAPERRFGIIGVGYDHPAIQIVFRGIAFDSITPRTKAMSARQTLMAVQPGPLGAGVLTVYHTIDAMQHPFPLKMDDSNRHYIACNYYIKKEP